MKYLNKLNFVAGITIVLFAIFFAPSSLMEQMITSLGFVNNSKAGDDNDNDKPEKKKIDTSDLNQDIKNKIKSSVDDVDKGEHDSEEIFDNTLVTYLLNKIKIQMIYLGWQIKISKISQFSPFISFLFALNLYF